MKQPTPWWMWLLPLPVVWWAALLTAGAWAAGGDGSAAADGGAEHGAAKTVDIRWTQYSGRCLLLFTLAPCGRDRCGAVKYNSYTPGRGTRFRTLGGCVQYCPALP